MEIIGKVKKVMDVQTFDSGFKKRELVITTQEKYPQDIVIEFQKDKVDLLNNLKVGIDIVNIGINIRGREWVSPDGISKYFNSIVGWRIKFRRSIIQK